MGKRRGNYESSKYKELRDDFEDFGYEVKNIRRQSKKKINRWKREVDEYYDSFWTVHYWLQPSFFCVIL